MGEERERAKRTEDATEDVEAHAFKRLVDEDAMPSTEADLGRMKRGDDSGDGEDDVEAHAFKR